MLLVMRPERTWDSGDLVLFMSVAVCGVLVSGILVTAAIGFFSRRFGRVGGVVMGVLCGLSPSILLFSYVLMVRLMRPGVEESAGTAREPAVCVVTIRGTEKQCENVPPPIVSAQTPQRQRILSGWQQKVEGAEKDYKNKHGRYGDLAALRKTHLLRGLIFEPCSLPGASDKEKANFVPKTTLIRVAGANFVPKTTLFRVAVSEDGQLFVLTIIDGAGHCDSGRPWHFERRDFDDSPEGPIVRTAG